MSMKARKVRKLKKAARREFINSIVNSIPAPGAVKRILRGLLSTLSLNLMFVGAMAYIVVWFVSSM
ncbi:hypothetical protein ACIQ57_24585 [Lysinibacillus xylanilyticus]|uniref:hypothetical protein n=1 Tax=Lysinibacillus xylanilyticus TaxID=582475 RepID=UPI00381826CC